MRVEKIICEDRLIYYNHRYNNCNRDYNMSIVLIALKRNIDNMRYCLFGFFLSFFNANNTSNRRNDR